MGLVESNQRQVSSNGLPVGQSLGAGNLPGTKPESFYRVSWGKVMMRAYVLSKTATLLGEACRSLSCLDFPVSILFHSFPFFPILSDSFRSFPILSHRFPLFPILSHVESLFNQPLHLQSKSGADGILPWSVITLPDVSEPT